jgi:hypothetical protein
VRDRLRQLSSWSDPFFFKGKLGGCVYDSYALCILDEAWPIAKLGVLAFVKRAAESKSPHLKRHNSQLLDFIVKFAEENPITCDPPLAIQRPGPLLRPSAVDNR